MQDALFVFENSAHVAKCCRILAADIFYNEITLTLNGIDEPDEHLVNQVKKINEYLNDNVDELYNLAVDYYYAGWCAMEYSWNNTRFTLKQIPIHTCKVVRVPVKGNEVYLLKQQINSKIHFFKIMGEEYPENFLFYNNQKLGNASLVGGDNIYAFFSLPKWLQNYKRILTEIAIASSDYRTVSNGNISSGILNINLEPQLPKPIQYDENNQPVIQPTRQDAISQELRSANGGTAVIFTESNRPVTLDYVGLTNNNSSYLSDLSDKCQEAVLNDYNIPKIRLMINTDKESMNSDKTKSLWRIYLENLKNEQKPWKLFISELIFDLYGLNIDVDISLPQFSDSREIEVNMLKDVWESGGLTLKQYVTGLSTYIEVIDLADYNFEVNPDVWNYRKVEVDPGLSDDDLAVIESVEAQLKGI